jgi:hypothetical protein
LFQTYTCSDRYGSWGVCFTYGTWFGVTGLVCAGRTFENSTAIRKACEFLLSKELPSGGWGESWLSSHNEVAFTSIYRFQSVWSWYFRIKCFCVIIVHSKKMYSNESTTILKLQDLSLLACIQLGLHKSYWEPTSWYAHCMGLAGTNWRWAGLLLLFNILFCGFSLRCGHSQSNLFHVCYRLKEIQCLCIEQQRFCSTYSWKMVNSHSK